MVESANKKLVEAIYGKGYGEGLPEPDPGFEWIPKGHANFDKATFYENDVQGNEWGLIFTGKGLDSDVDWEVTSHNDEKAYNRLRKAVEELEALGEIDPFEASDYLDMEIYEIDLESMEREIRKLKRRKKVRDFVKKLKNFLVR